VRGLGDPPPAAPPVDWPACIGRGSVPQMGDKKQKQVPPPLHTIISWAKLPSQFFFFFYLLNGKEKKL
jgi:hypothetical protein